MKQYLAVSLLLLSISCKSRHSPVDPAEAQKACAGAADAAATLDRIAESLRTTVPAPDEKLAAAGAPPVLGDAGNTIVVESDALKVPGAVEHALPSLVWDSSLDAARTLKVARTGIDVYGTAVEHGELGDLRKKCDRVGAATYVLVVHTTERALPFATYADGEKTFTPGAIAGSAHLFEIATGRHLGGFAVRATNSDSVSATVTPGQPGGANQELEEDLETNYWISLQASFHSLAGGA